MPIGVVCNPEYDALMFVCLLGTHICPSIIPPNKVSGLLSSHFTYMRTSLELNLQLFRLYDGQPMLIPRKYQTVNLGDIYFHVNQ